MRVGMIGLGRLGMPVALALDSIGHDVMGYDPSPERAKGWYPAYERLPDGKPLATLEGVDRVGYGTLDEVVAHADVVLLAIQTPHAEWYDGTSPLPRARADFEYGFLQQALTQVLVASTRRFDPLVVGIISTVLPRTTRRLVGTTPPPPNVTVVYTPSFIAMGTTMRDFLDPEFVLVGSTLQHVPLGAEERIKELYSFVPHDRIVWTSYESAELAKVTINTFITAKLAVVNTMMEIAHRVGADCDEVSDVIERSTRRVVSPMYLRGGMGDGGACHPRDNIALSWLARECKLSFDLYEALMLARENQARFFARLVRDAITQRFPQGARVAILGYAYKPDVALSFGSHALLLGRILRTEYDIDVALLDPVIEPFQWEAVVADFDIVFIGCAHAGIAEYQFRAGSVVIDPNRIVGDKPGIVVLRIGERQS